MLKHLKLKHEAEATKAARDVEYQLNYLKDPKKPSYPIVAAPLDAIPPILIRDRERERERIGGDRERGGGHWKERNYDGRRGDLHPQPRGK